MASECFHAGCKEEDHLNYLKSILQRFLLKKGRILLGFVEEFAFTHFSMHTSVNC